MHRELVSILQLVWLYNVDELNKMPKTVELLRLLIIFKPRKAHLVAQTSERWVHMVFGAHDIHK